MCDPITLGLGIASVAGAGGATAGAAGAAGAGGVSALGSFSSLLSIGSAASSFVGPQPQSSGLLESLTGVLGGADAGSNILGGLSTGLGVFGSIEQGRDISTSLTAKAHIAERNIGIARNMAAMQAGDIRREGRLLQGEQIAAVGASGVTLEGTPSQVISLTAKLTELEARRALYQGEISATDYTNRASVYRHEARRARSQGALGAGSAGLGGILQALSGA